MTAETGSREAFADQLLDELVPDEVDWRDLVTSYPLTSLGLAALGGYLLGRSKGSVMVASLGAFATETVTRNLNDLIGDEVL